MYEYKVITERDSRLTGRYDPAELEEVLNAYAADGWRLAEALVAANVWKSIKAEFLMILERPRPSDGAV